MDHEGDLASSASSSTEDEQSSEDEDSEEEQIKKTKHISIVRMKLSDERISLDNVLKKIKELYETKEEQESGMYCKFIKEKPYPDKNHVKFHVAEYGIKTTSKLIPGKKDVNHGKMYFYYWKTNGKVKVYAIVKSGRSNAWIKLHGHRDTQFPKKFAGVFLDPCAIRQTTGIYLAGPSSGDFTKRYPKADSFYSPEVIRNYGVIEKLNAPVLQNENGKQLLKLLSCSDKNVMKILLGQVKLRTDKDLTIEDRYRILQFIEKKVPTFQWTDASDKWKFLTYVQMIGDVTKIKLKERLRNEMKTVHDERLKESDAFEMNSYLVHQHQDSFDNCNDVEVFSPHGQLSWTNYPDDFTKRGEDIRVKDVFHALEMHEMTTKTKFDSLKQISLRFFNYTTNKTEKVKFVDFLVTQTVFEESIDERKSYFQYGKKWYMVELDTMMDTTKHFINIVKRCSMRIPKGEKQNYPEILPRCTKDKDNKPHFLMEKLIEFVRTDNSVTPDSSTLQNILTKSRSLFREEVTEITYLETNWKNNFGGSKSYTSNSEHDTHLLDINMSAMETTDLGKCKLFKGSSGRQNSAVMWEFQQAVKTCDTLKDVKKRVVEDDRGKLKSTKQNKKLGKENDENEGAKKKMEIILETWQEVEKELKKKRQCLVNKNDDLFEVSSPFLTTDLLLELQSHKVCPVRLLQFLRMYTPKDEGEYNELYHLSNCKCRRSPWQYIVGDRIFDKENQWIELFDVMALNKDRKEAYLFHVKHGIDAGAFRSACSQVRVCGDEIWKAISANSVTDVLQKFYDSATKVADDKEDMHKKLTKREIESVSCDKEDFLSMMYNDQMTFFICLSPCQEEAKHLGTVFKCNLDYKFKREDFSSIKNAIDTFTETGIINEKSKRLTSKYFGTKTAVVELLKKSHKHKDANSMYDIVKEKTGGSDDYVIKGSFIAKVSVIDLYRVFADFRVSGNSRINLKIWEINDLQARKPKNRKRKQNTPKEQHPITKFFKKITSPVMSADTTDKVIGAEMDDDSSDYS